MSDRRLGDGDELGGPRAALSSLQGRIDERGRQVRARMQTAALEVSGEVGYCDLTVESILLRCGANRTLFYRTFADKAECYACAYAETSELLAAELLSAGADAPSWLAGFRQALERLASFMEAEPLLARGLLAESRIAGPEPFAKRIEVFERLSRAIDCARRETLESRHSPPPITASFILSAIEAVVLQSLTAADGVRFRQQIGTLVHLAGLFYFGDETGRELRKEA
jgi:AcrR family transcriptional regulator